MAAVMLEHNDRRTSRAFWYKMLDVAIVVTFTAGAMVTANLAEKGHWLIGVASLVSLVLAFGYLAILVKLEKVYRK